MFILVKPQAPHDVAESGMARGAGGCRIDGVRLVPYGTLWAERYAQIDAKLEDPTVSYIDDPEDGSFYHVSSYDIKLKRSPNDELRVMAKLTIPASELSGMRRFR